MYGTRDEKRRHGFSLLVVLCFATAQLTYSYGQDKTAIVITSADDQKVVSFRRGDRIIVKLDVLPANGYMWYLKEVKANALRSIAKTRFQPIPGEKAKPGVREVQVFEFQALEPSATNLEFVYKRSGDQRKQFCVKLRPQ